MKSTLSLSLKPYRIVRITRNQRPWLTAKIKTEMHDAYVATESLGSSGKLGLVRVAGRLWAGLVRVQTDLGVHTETLADLGRTAHLTRQSGVRGVREGSKVLDREAEPARG